MSGNAREQAKAPSPSLNEAQHKPLSGMLYRSAARAEKPAAIPAIVHEVLRSSGQPLDAATRAYMEPRFGHDFSRVRVHTDTLAAESARAVNANAYAMGNDLVFNDGQYNPYSSPGQSLLAHELTHVVQADRAPNPIQDRIAPNDHPSEIEADKMADGFNTSTVSAPGGALQRTPFDPKYDPVRVKEIRSKELVDYLILGSNRFDPEVSALFRYFADRLFKEQKRSNGSSTQEGNPAELKKLADELDLTEHDALRIEKRARRYLPEDYVVEADERGIGTSQSLAEREFMGKFNVIANGEVNIMTLIPVLRGGTAEEWKAYSQLGTDLWTIASTVASAREARNYNQSIKDSIENQYKNQAGEARPMQAPSTTAAQGTKASGSKKVTPSMKSSPTAPAPQGVSNQPRVSAPPKVIDPPKSLNLPRSTNPPTSSQTLDPVLEETSMRELEIYIPGKTTINSHEENHAMETKTVKPNASQQPESVTKSTPVEKKKQATSTKSAPIVTTTNEAKGTKSSNVSKSGNLNLNEEINKAIDEFIDKLTKHDQPFEIQGRRGFQQRGAAMDIDEWDAVGHKGITDDEARTRAMDVDNRQFLDKATNSQTKHLGTAGQRVEARPAISVKDNPNALIERRFSEITEMREIFNEAVSKIKDPSKGKPTSLKKRINGEVWNIIRTSNSESARNVREALKQLGFVDVPQKGYVMQRVVESDIGNVKFRVSEEPPQKLRIAAPLIEEEEFVLQSEEEEIEQMKMRLKE